MDSNSFGNFLPIIQKIASRSIGLDLVSVKPLSVPTGKMLYMDYEYESINVSRQKKIESIFEKIKNLDR